MALDDLVFGARRFLGRAALAVGLGLVGLGAYAAGPVTPAPFTLDAAPVAAAGAQGATPTPTPRPIRRHVPRAVPPEEYAFLAANTAQESSTITVTNPTGVAAAVSFYVGGRQVPYTVPAGQAVTIPSSELNFAGDDVIFEHVTGADPSQVATFVRTERSSLQGGVRSWTGNGSSAIPLADFLTSGEVAKLPLAGGSAHTLYLVGGHDVAANGLVNLQLQVVDVNGAVKKDGQGNPAQGSYTLNALGARAFNPETEWNITLATPDPANPYVPVGDQLIVYPFGGQVQVVDARTLASGDRLERAATTTTQIDSQFDVPIMQRTAGTTTPTAWTTFGAMNMTTGDGTVNLNYTDRGNGESVGAFNGYNVIGSTQSVWNDAIQDFMHLTPDIAHLGESHGQITAGTLLPYSEIYSTTGGQTVGAVVPLLRTRDLVGANNTRALLHALSENGDEATRLGLLNNWGATQTIHADCYKGDGTKTAGFDEQVTAYANITLDHVLTQQCGMTSPVEDAYLILSNPASQQDTPTPQFHAWSELTSTLTGDTHVQKATKLLAPPVTGEQYVAMYLDQLKTGNLWLANNEVYCMLRGDCGVPSIENDLGTILSRGIGETWTPTQFDDWMTQFSNHVTTTSDPELCLTIKPFTRGQGGIAFAITTNPNTCTSEPGSVQLTTTDNNQVYNLIRGFLVNLVTTHPDWYGGNTTTGPSLLYSPTWNTPNPR